MSHMTPQEIVHELDKHIIGQDRAKRAVAIALRNRWRRQQVAEPLRHEITPKNILMIGPTGVGKTEIARRLAKLADAPFIKVEATKFTEVGYVGRDVDTIVRDLVEISIKQTREQAMRKVKARADDAAEDRILDGSDLRLARQALAAVVAKLAREGVIVKSGAGVRLPAHSSKLSVADAALWRKIAPLLETKTRVPLLVSEIAAAVGGDIKAIDAALQRVSRYGLVLRVSPNRFFLPSVARQYAEIAQEAARLDGHVTVAAFRDRSGLGRNLAIEVLEFFDRFKFTRRIGDARAVLRPANEVFVDQPSGL